MNSNRIFKKGEVIFKEGDKSTNAYLIQAGQVQVYIQKTKQKIDLYRLGPMQILGEQVLSGSTTHSASAVAITETKAVELPAEGIKTQIGELSQVMKLVVKSTMDKLKVMSTELRSIKLERDNTPCPQDITAKIFGSIYHTVHHKGEKTGEKYSIGWTPLKQYAQRVFGESPKHTEGACNLFVKMKLAEYQKAKDPEDPEGPEQIATVHFSNLPAIETFFEFYQHYYFKGGKLDFLKADDLCGRVVTQILDITKDIPPDRYGIVHIPYEEAVEKLKAGHQFSLNADHFAVLEQKGLFARRNSTDKGVLLSFDLKEWQRTLLNWRILKEIDKWNDKGSVEPSEPEEGFNPKKVSKLSPACPECQTPFIDGARFCSNCGHKLGGEIKVA